MKSAIGGGESAVSRAKSAITEEATSVVDQIKSTVSNAKSAATEESHVSRAKSAITEEAKSIVNKVKSTFSNTKSDLSDDEPNVDVPITVEKETSAKGKSRYDQDESPVSPGKSAVKKEKTTVKKSKTAQSKSRIDQEKSPVKSTSKKAKSFASEEQPTVVKEKPFSYLKEQAAVQNAKETEQEDSTSSKQRKTGWLQSLSSFSWGLAELLMMTLIGLLLYSICCSGKSWTHRPIEIGHAGSEKSGFFGSNGFVGNWLVRRRQGKNADARTYAGPGVVEVHSGGSGYASRHVGDNVVHIPVYPDPRASSAHYPENKVAV
jgi:hypothetical protein